MWFIKVVKQYEKLVVLRFGRYVGLRGPGLRLLIPFLDVGRKIDMRESFVSIPHQTNITKDNAPISIDFLIYSRVLEDEAQKSVLDVQDFRGAITGMATTTLRAVIGDILLDDVLAKREEINIRLRTKLDEVTLRWGVKVTAVEIREIIPPKEIQDSMNRQMAAERVRRAVILEAEGIKQSKITVAEGEKQSAILKAEGGRQAAILEAEGERQAAVLRAEGFSMALDKIFAVAKNVDGNTLSLQYFDTLKALGNSPSTKWVFPMEFTRMLQPFFNTLNQQQKDSGQG